MRRGFAPLLLVATLFTTATNAAEFSIAFEWGDIPLCTSGLPNKIPNPRFTVSNVPPETKIISFRLTDLDAPSYDHGGGNVAFSGQSVIEPGAFTYKSPCPPSGSHRYQWTASAKNGTDISSGSIASATAKKSYP